jgi:hypothetical protein
MSLVRFVALDVETANENIGSICQEGDVAVLFLIFISSRAFTRLRRASYFWQSPKSNQKAGAERGVLIRFLRIKIPCASRRGGVAQTVRPCTASQSR